jgi:hypothetical protein
MSTKTSGGLIDLMGYDMTKPAKEELSLFRFDGFHYNFTYMQ